MKALLVLLLTLHAQALTLTVTWEAFPSAYQYRVWRGIEVIATVVGTEAAIELPSDSSSTLTVTAVTYSGETPHSAPLEIFIPALPKVTVQFSGELMEWTDKPFPAARFFRAKIEYP